MEQSSSNNIEIKIRQFIETLSPEELLELYQTVTSPGYIGLITDEIRKIAPKNPGNLISRNARAFSKLWKHANSMEFLNGISDFLVKEVSKELLDIENNKEKHKVQ